MRRPANPFAVARKATFKFNKNNHVTIAQAAQWAKMSPTYFQYQVAPFLKLTKYTDGTRMFYKKDELLAGLKTIRENRDSRGFLTAGTIRRRKSAPRRAVLMNTAVKTNRNGTSSMTGIVANVDVATFQRLLKAGIPVTFNIK